MPPRTLLAAALFLVFVGDAGTPYGSAWFTPFKWANFVMLEALPWKLRGFDHVVLYCLYAVGRKARSRTEQILALRKALLISVGTLIAGLLYGLMRGGDAWAGSWQIYLLLSGVLFAFTVSAVYRTPADFVYLAKVLLWAAGYRAAMCCLFYFFHIVDLPREDRPEFLTSHDDTVLWVTAALIMIVSVLQGTARGAKDYLFLALLFGAIFFNQRRLAWVSLVMGLATCIALLPPGKGRRRTKRFALALAPVIAIYVIVGWGRTETIFKPLQSFATVTTHEDASTLARNAENLGLIATLNQSSLLLGSGWGHPYYEYSNKYSIAQFFPLWKFVPHNSILAILAFSGALGFYGFWLPFPTAMLLNARLARYAQSALARNVGLIGCAQAVVCSNQFYGDMGSYFPKPVYCLALSYAIALHLPHQAGVWSAPAPAAQRS